MIGKDIDTSHVPNNYARLLNFYLKRKRRRIEYSDISEFFQGPI